MTLFQHTLGQLLRGEKTETSRIIKDGDYTFVCGHRPAMWHPRNDVSLYSSVHTKIGTTRFVEGRDYAISPGRGKFSIGRYKIEAIWRQDVRHLMHDQLKAEGFHDAHPGEARYRFLQIWTAMHDRKFKWWFDSQILDYRLKIGRTEDICDYKTMMQWIGNRPAEYYQAWRMKIEVLYETINWDAPTVLALRIDHHA